MALEIKDETKKPDEEITLQPGKIMNPSGCDPVIVHPDTLGDPIVAIAENDFLHPVTHEMVEKGQETSLPPRMFDNLLDNGIVSEKPTKKPAIKKSEEVK